MLMAMAMVMVKVKVMTLTLVIVKINTMIPAINVMIRHIHTRKKMKKTPF